MILNRQKVIWGLLFISSMAVGQMLFMFTAPIHEFGHYIVGKKFGWNITDIDWYSYIEYSRETMDNAPRIQKIFVNISGMIFMPIIPYIISTRKKSIVLKVVALPYFVLGFEGSISDIKNVIWNLLIDTPITTTEIFSAPNLMVTTLTTLVMVCVIGVAVYKYLRCIDILSIVINNLDDDQEGEQGDE